MIVQQPRGQKKADTRAWSSDPRVVEDYLKLWARRPHLHRSVLRAGSTHARELLVGRAAHPHWRWTALRDDVLDSLERGDVYRHDVWFRSHKLTSVLDLARVVAVQNLQRDDQLFSYAVYRSLIEKHGVGVLKAPHAKLAASLSLRLGRCDVAQLVLDAGLLQGLDEVCMRADLANPFIGGNSDLAAWLRLLNWQFIQDGVAELELLPNGAPDIFDRLAANAGASINQGPLVTVVITSWCPGEELRNAFRSISRQTWRNLEILLIDDCSPDSYSDILQSVVSEDSRARLIRMPKNGGTYLARNRGLMEARGELFTVHDSDDWAHPERIERQVARLISRPQLVSTTSRALRLDSDLVFTLPGVSASRENASSLMFWREKAMDAIGFYDGSRKGADTEYAVRLIQSFGAGSHELLPEHLACIRLTYGSLSRNEFKPGWRHPARAAYRRGYLWWHQNVSQRGGKFHLGNMPARRSFPQPLTFAPEQEARAARERRKWDVVYLFDARETAPPPAGYLSELLTLADAGAKVAVMHVESLRYEFKREFEVFSLDLQELLSQGRVGEVLPTDAVDIATLVVRDPSCLQFNDDESYPFAVGRVLVVPDQLPTTRPFAYSCSDVNARIRKKLEIQPTWLAPPGESAFLSEYLLCEPRAWEEQIVHRFIYAAPRSPVSWGDSVRLGCLVNARSLPLDQLEELSRRADLRVWAPHYPYPGRHAAPGVRVQRSPTPGILELALLDILLLVGDVTPDARTVAIQAAVSGCVLLAASDPWATHFDHPALRMPENHPGGLSAWLPNLLSSPDAVAANRQASLEWKEKAVGAAPFVKQIFHQDI